MNDRCSKCTGTGRTPAPDEAFARITRKAVEAQGDGSNVDANVRGEDEVAWADVLALCRFWREAQK